jgi:hypothetical protein
MREFIKKLDDIHEIRDIDGANWDVEIGDQKEGLAN